MALSTGPLKDLDETLVTVQNIVRQAGSLLLGYSADGRVAVRKKSDIDFATAADIEVDVFLREKITASFANAILLSEESSDNLTYAQITEVINSCSSLWVIDPLDGTTNFSRGSTNYCISVALVSHGQVILGVVYRPVTKELFYTHAKLSRSYNNDRPLSVSPTQSIFEAVIGCDWAWDLGERNRVVKWIGCSISHVRQVKCMGSAASDLCAVAQGNIDVYLHSGLKPWDTAAASLIVKKAGGHISTPDGATWVLSDAQILASNGILHDGYSELIR